MIQSRPSARFPRFSSLIFLFSDRGNLWKSPRLWQIPFQPLSEPLAVCFAAMFQAVRALMIVGIVLGILGLLVCIFALKCIRIGSMEDTAKANMTLTSGIMFIIAGKWGLSCLPHRRLCISLELRTGQVLVRFWSYWHCPPAWSPGVKWFLPLIREQKKSLETRSLYGQNMEGWKHIPQMEKEIYLLIHFIYVVVMYYHSVYLYRIFFTSFRLYP